jgi:hypothetical protein
MVASVAPHPAEYLRLRSGPAQGDTGAQVGQGMPNGFLLMVPDARQLVGDPRKIKLVAAIVPDQISLMLCPNRHVLFVRTAHVSPRLDVDDEREEYDKVQSSVVGRRR